MSQEGMRDLLNRVESDEGFRDQLLTAGSVEERVHLVHEAGYDVGPNDLPAFREMVQFGELSDDDLELVAGGMGNGTVAGIGAGVSAGVGVGIASAAAAAAVAVP